MAYNRFEKIDGFTFYAWVSLVVKSIRIGWPEGVRQAETRIGGFVTKKTAVVQIFEDILPAEADVAEINRKIWAGDWDGLCAYDTHHGRGETDWYIKEWESGLGDWAGKHETEVRRIAETQYGFKKIQPRMCGDFWTWYNIKSKIPTTGERELDTTPWNGMPPDILDMHTVEGKQMKTNVTILSGSNDGHIKLGRMVKTMGWGGVRRLVHQKRPLQVTGVTVKDKPSTTTDTTPTPPRPKGPQKPKQLTLLAIY